MLQVVRIKTKHYYGFILGCERCIMLKLLISFQYMDTLGKCDRNFGVIRNTLKNVQYVEEPKQFGEEFPCRQNPSPFRLSHDPSIVFDWDSALMSYYLRTPSKKLMSLEYNDTVSFTTSLVGHLQSPKHTI